MKEKSFEASLAKALRSHGYDTPLHEDELISSKKVMNQRQYPDLPTDLDSIAKILEKGPVSSLPELPTEIEEDTVRNLAMAARQGGKISQEIRKKMDDDRKNSQK